MDLDRTPREIARTLADEARALNHRTIDPTAFYGHDEDGAFINSAPGEAAATAEQLLVLTGRLPQALEQLSQAVQHLEEQQAIRMADGSVVEESMSRVLRGLLDARQAIQVANVHLREISGPLAAMGGHFVGNVELAEDGATGAR